MLSVDSVLACHFASKFWLLELIFFQGLVFTILLFEKGDIVIHLSMIDIIV